MSRWIVVWGAVLIGAMTTVINANASCAFPPGTVGQPALTAQIDAAPVAFVGTVVSTSNGDRVARVKVESVWKGPAVLTLVTVSGTPETGSAATSVDRTYVAGQRYLFVPFSASPPYQDNNCSATQPYSGQLDASRPATAHPPAPGSDGLDPAGPFTFWMWPALAGLVIAGAVAAVLLARRRRREPRAHEGSDMDLPGTPI